MSTPELRPCPFCGAEAEIRDEHPITCEEVRAIACTNGECPAVVFVELDDDEDAEAHAILAWNSRAEARSEVA